MMKLLLVLVMAVVFVFLGSSVYADFFTSDWTQQEIAGCQLEISSNVTGAVCETVDIGVEFPYGRTRFLHDISSLGPGQYTFRARWRNEEMWSDWSEPVDTFKPTITMSVRIVDGLLVCDLQAGITQYEIDVNGGIVVVTAEPDGSVIFDLADLPAGDYTFRVRGGNDFGWYGAWSDPMTASKPEAPGNLRVVP